MTPITNVLMMAEAEESYLRHLNEYLDLCDWLPKNRIEAHQQRLGRQTAVRQFSHRTWIWERPGWTVYISLRGITFEVADDFTAEQAMAAWADYLRLIGYPWEGRRSQRAARVPRAAGGGRTC